MFQWEDDPRGFADRDGRLLMAKEKEQGLSLRRAPVEKVRLL